MLSSMITENAQSVGQPQPVRATGDGEEQKSEKQNAAKTAPAGKPEETEEPVVDRAQAEAAIVEALGPQFPSNASLKIDIAEETGQFVYKAVDRDSGEVVKQFPPEQVLEQLGRRAKIHGNAIDGTV